jgi:transcriptional regulator with PAS, ATPase and Fis domain
MKHAAMSDPQGRSLRGSEATSKSVSNPRGDERYLVAFLKDGMGVTRISSNATVVVGRSTQCEVPIDQPALSRKHFAIRRAEELTIRDVGSANGTRVNGKPLKRDTDVDIEPGTLIEAGGVYFMIQDHDPGDGAHATSGNATTTASMEGDPATVVADPRMAQLHKLVDQVARYSTPVLVVGETGVGKEMVSTAIHSRSPRGDKPLVRINCAAMPESLLESELFGYERGAFTGASQGKPGLIESADGGSFLLDEVGELPLTTQAKLLRVLESGEIMRLGALQPRHVDVRFIAATNRDLLSLIVHGGFRQDLYYRLNGITIAVPPLRERVPEIPKLAESFLCAAAKRAGRRAPTISSDTHTVLERHPWPGNVRELKNVMERALMVCSADVVRPEHILLDPDLSELSGRPPSEGRQAPRRPSSRAPKEAGAEDGSRAARPLRLDAQTERSLIEKALHESAGHQGRAAKSLGISRRTLINRLVMFGIKRPRKQ